MSKIITQDKFKQVASKEQWLADELMDTAMSIHSMLGPELLESIYKKCFCYELSKRNISFVTKQSIPVVCDNMLIDEGLQIDFVIEDIVIIELKAQEIYRAAWETQLLSYLKLTGKRFGYIMNFRVPSMKDGIRQMIR